MAILTVALRSQVPSKLSNKVTQFSNPAYTPLSMTTQAIRIMYTKQALKLELDWSRQSEHISKAGTPWWMLKIQS